MKRKNYNYNYVFVMYDVNEKRCQKVFKVCKKYLSHYQNSVFRGEITPSKLILLKNELNKIIVPSDDFISIIKLVSRYDYEQEELGSRAIMAEDLIL